MGANDVLPAVPTFAAGAPTIAQLNALSYGASFLIDHGVRPTWKFFATTTQTTTAHSLNVVHFNNVAYDCDGVYNAGNNGANIVTQGYYEVEASVQIEATATGDDIVLGFQWSPGSSNPHFSAGTQSFGFAGCALPVTGSAAADASYSISGVTPFPCYPGGDVIQVVLYTVGAHTIDYNRNTSFSQGRFSTQFTGRWVRSGT
jgi:hypothetical protein